MARLSKEALERALTISEKSDEEIGRWLADLAREPVENALRRVDADRLTALYIMGSALIDTFFDSAIRFDRDAPESLALWLALRGEYTKAGKALRSSRGMIRVHTLRRQDAGRRKGQETASDRKKRKESEWQRIGLAIRKAERGLPMTNQALAGRIVAKCKKADGGAANSIRVALPRLGLDRKAWLPRKPVKKRARSKTKRIIRTYGSLSH